MANRTATRSEPRESTGSLRELFLGALWIGTSMYAAHLALKGKAGDLSGIFADAAVALPGLVAATILTSASIAAAASSRFGNAFARLFVGLGVGVAFGALAAFGLRYGYGTDRPITVLAVTVAAASVVGGLVAILPSAVLDAGLWATSWVFFAGVMIGTMLPLALSGVNGSDPANPAPLSGGVLAALSVLTGVFGGWQGSGWMRFADRPAVAWYLVAGAVPGLILVAAEWLTRAGGTAVARLTEGFDVDRSLVLQLNDASRLRHALIVLPVGALVALALGARERARDRREEEADEDD